MINIDRKKHGPDKTYKFVCICFKSRNNSWKHINCDLFNMQVPSAFPTLSQSWAWPYASYLGPLVLALWWNTSAPAPANPCFPPPWNHLSSEPLSVHLSRCPISLTRFHFLERRAHVEFFCIPHFFQVRCRVYSKSFIKYILCRLFYFLSEAYFAFTGLW